MAFLQRSPPLRRWSGSHHGSTKPGRMDAIKGRLSHQAPLFPSFCFPHFRSGRTPHANSGEPARGCPLGAVFPSPAWVNLLHWQFRQLNRPRIQCQPKHKFRNFLLDCPPNDHVLLLLVSTVPPACFLCVRHPVSPVLLLAMRPGLRPPMCPTRVSLALPFPPPLSVNCLMKLRRCLTVGL